MEYNKCKRNWQEGYRVTLTRASTYAHTAIHTLLLKEGSYKNDLSSVLRIRMHVCTVHILCSSCQM